MDRSHDEWLGMVRPIDGLVIAKQALLDAQVARPEAARIRRLYPYVSAPQIEQALELENQLADNLTQRAA